VSYAYGDLEFWVSPEYPPDPGALPPASSGVPTRLEQGDRTLSFGLLVGEVLGVYVDDARLLIQDVDQLPDSIAHVFLEDDLAVLIETFDRVRDALAAAVDAEGRPTGEGGRALAEHPLIGQSEAGRLYVRPQRVDLADLVHDLDQLGAFLAWATDHELLVSKQFLPG
jgi:hypothetical protein